MTGPDDRQLRGAGTVKPPVHRVFVGQCLLLLVVSATATLYRQDVAVSLLLGGIIHLLPTIYFARQVFRFSGARAAHRVAQSFYRGELGKFLLTGLGFALVFTLVESLNPLALFVGYGLMLVSHAAGVVWLNQ